jgi:hypothetical protein
LVSNHNFLLLALGSWCLWYGASKKQKGSGGFHDQSIDQLHDVTVVSGVNLRVCIHKFSNVLLFFWFFCAHTYDEWTSMM